MCLFAVYYYYHYYLPLLPKHFANVFYHTKNFFIIIASCWFACQWALAADFIQIEIEIETNQWTDLPVKTGALKKVMHKLAAAAVCPVFF